MQLKLILLTLLPHVLALPNAIPEPAPVSEPYEPNSLIARSCSYSTGCESEPGAKAGAYCGFCTQVRVVWNVDDIYQVNGGTGTSSCCNYGYSSACAAEWPKVSPNVLVNCADNSRGY